jgi:hypothetical protein
MPFTAFPVHGGAFFTGASRDQGTVAYPLVVVQIGRALRRPSTQSLEGGTLVALLEPENPASASIRKIRAVISVAIMSEFIFIHHRKYV